jgi:hypothetical protein
VAAAPTMLWQPAFMGILPIFVWCMLALPPFLWLAARIGAWALAVPAGLYAGVQLFGWATPPLGVGTGIAFDPLAWQVLFLGGAFLGRRALLSGAPAVPRRRGLVVAAVAMLAFGLWFRMVEYGWIAGPAALDTRLVLGKERLAVPRLLHALSIAYLVAAFVPREARWMHGRAGRALAAVGWHSLHVFCLGLFLSYGAATAFRLWPDAPWWLDPLLIGAGAAVLIGFARWADRRRAAGAAAPPARGAAAPSAAASTPVAHGAAARAGAA